MNQLTLEWIESEQLKQQVLSDQQITKSPGTVRIGRDATQSDIVISDMSVAPCHAEIFFSPQQQCFYLRNLRDTNPPVVNGMLLRQGEAMLDEGSTIQLGAIALQVRAVNLGKQQQQQSSGGYIPTSYATQVTPDSTIPPTVAATNHQQTPPTFPRSQYPNTVEPTIVVSPAYHAPTPVTPVPTTNRRPLLLSIGAAVLSATVAGIVIASMQKTSTTSPAITQSTPTSCSAVVTGSIRSEPASFRDNTLNFDGNNFTVTGKQTPGEWVELKLPDGRLGWAHRDVISNASAMDSCLRTNGISIQTAEDIAPPPKPVQVSQPQQPSSKPAVPEKGGRQLPEWERLQYEREGKEEAAARSQPSPQLDKCVNRRTGEIIEDTAANNRRRNLQRTDGWECGIR